MTNKPVKLPEAGQWPDKVAPWALLAGIVLSTLGFLMAFLYAGPVNGAAVDGVELIGGQMVANKLLLSQKIFYFHMPVALVSFCALAFACYYSVRFLATKNQRFDTCAKVCMEISLVFVVCTMITGDLWERFEWGVWWTWEPRLTTYFILMLLVMAYFILRNAIDDPERRARFCAVFGIVAFVDAPISFMVTRVIPSSIHPVVFRTDSGLPPMMLVPFLLGMFGMLMVCIAIYVLAVRVNEQAVVVEELKERLEERDASRQVAVADEALARLRAQGEKLSAAEADDDSKKEN